MLTTDLPVAVPRSYAQVDDLVVEFTGRRKETFRAVDSVSFAIEPGQCMGLVGESGSGKSTIGRVLLGLEKATSGEARVGDLDLVSARGNGRRSRATTVQAIFQDPYSSLHPLMTVREILTEPLRTVLGMSATAALERVHETLDRVGLPAASLARRPSDFSGGQRQRIAIARALVMTPGLIVCDEPVSALDLSTQRRVLDLIIEVQRQTNVAMLFISHDLAVVRRVCHDVAVIHRGRFVEHGPSDVVTSSPQDEYSRVLMMSSPLPDPARQRQRREQLNMWRQNPNRTTHPAPMQLDAPEHTETGDM